jgi:hypothetical protein
VRQVQLYSLRSVLLHVLEFGLEERRRRDRIEGTFKRSTEAVTYHTVVGGSKHRPVPYHNRDRFNRSSNQPTRVNVRFKASTTKPENGPISVDVWIQQRLKQSKALTIEQEGSVQGDRQRLAIREQRICDKCKAIDQDQRCSTVDRLL